MQREKNRATPLQCGVGISFCFISSITPKTCLLSYCANLWAIYELNGAIFYAHTALCFIIFSSLSWTLHRVSEVRCEQLQLHDRKDRHQPAPVPLCMDSYIMYVSAYDETPRCLAIISPVVELWVLSRGDVRLKCSEWYYLWGNAILLILYVHC